MYILGISCFYHDSAACLLKDGVPISAADEQSFSRQKHDSGFPIQSIKWNLENAGISIEDIEAVAFYEKPLVKFERILKSHIANFPQTSFNCLGMPKLFAKLQLAKVLEDKPATQVQLL